MAKIDRLIKKASPKPTIQQCMEKDNPYLGKSLDELLDYLSVGNYRAPEKGRTLEWSKFMYALMHSKGTGGLKE